MKFIDFFLNILFFQSYYNNFQILKNKSRNENEYF